MKALLGCVSAAAIAVSLAFGAPASAAPILGSNVDAALFNTALGSTTGWSYLGQSTSAFSGSGTATLIARSAGWANNFGFAQLDHSGRTQVIGTGGNGGDTFSVAGYASSYLLYFQTTNSGIAGVVDSNRQFTDGFSSGGAFGRSQGDIDIFRNATTNTWAFFFDDGGGSLFADDNDYNDLIVTFAQPISTPSPVPEPGSLSLLGLSLLGLAYLRRRKAAAFNA